jgi:hypothetical protein
VELREEKKQALSFFFERTWERSQVIFQFLDKERGEMDKITRPALPIFSKPNHPKQGE